MAQVLFTGDTTPSQADLDANFTELYGLASALHTRTFTVSGDTTTVTTAKITTYSSANAGAGGLVLIRGTSSSGIATARLYLVATRVLGGASPDVASTLVATAGSTAESFSFSASGGFVAVTGSSTGGGTYAGLMLGMRG